jgi:hypothetical protein
MIPDRIKDTWTADSEAASERDGYLSYRAEWHSAAWGFAVFFLATLTGRLELVGAVVVWALRGSTDAGKLNLPYPKQFARETAYLLGHGLVGILLALPVRTVVGTGAIPSLGGVLPI